MTPLHWKGLYVLEIVKLDFIFQSFGIIDSIDSILEL